MAVAIAAGSPSPALPINLAAQESFKVADCVENGENCEMLVFVSNPSKTVVYDPKLKWNVKNCRVFLFCVSELFFY